jgi:hypothetical protein
MSPIRSLSLLAVWMLATGPAAAQARDGAWVSYRDAYRAMVVFEKYGQPKHLIQSQLQVMPRAKGVSRDGLRLALEGKSTQLNLALDATGRTVFPLLKAAYDDNAALVLDRNVGQFAVRPRVTVAVRADGVYEAAELRAACDQALHFARHVEASARSLACAGVRFGFAGKGAAAALRLRNGEAAALLAVGEGRIFDDDADDGFQTVLVRFTDMPARAQLMTRQAPLAIVPVFE